MHYSLYFHDDFDGVTSGAVMLHFLRSRGDDIAYFEAVNYGTLGFRNQWPEKNFQKPSIVVDFLYHPDADWWFDHHQAPSSFILPEWRERYVDDDQHRFRPGMKSCCGLILQHFKETYAYQPPDYIEKLVEFADLVDGAGFKTPAEAFDSNNPIILMARSIKPDRHQDEYAHYTQFLIESLSQHPLQDVAETPQIRDQLDYQKTIMERVRSALPGISQIVGDVIFVDASGLDDVVSNTMPYYFFESPYSVIIRKNGDGFHVNLGSNPWKRPEYSIDLSEIARKYGGGGHSYAAGIEIHTVAEAQKIAEAIIQTINEHK